MNRKKVSELMSDVALNTNQMNFAFKLQTPLGIGTCFLYGTASGFFHVTAAHLMKSTKIGDNIRIAYKDDWLTRQVIGLYFDDDGYDIAVFVTDQHVGGSSEFSNDFKVMPGQPMKFLGFPHGLTSDYPSGFGYPTPLVRTAHFSGNVIVDGRRLCILDGFNNPGYSGAPVYCCGEDGDPKLFGVISAYRFEREDHSHIYKKNSQNDFEPIPDYTVRINSGMIYVVGVDRCRVLFEKVDVFQPMIQIEQL